MSRKKPITYTEKKDPDTDEVSFTRAIHVSDMEAGQIKSELGGMLGRVSPLGQLHQLRHLVEKISDIYPEKTAALDWISRGENTTSDDIRMLAIQNVRSQLNHIKFRAEKLKLKKNRSRGGKNAAVSKQDDNKSRNNQIIRIAKQMAREGEKKSYIVAKLAERNQLSERQIARILKKDDTN